jgi:hypothetical protein
MLRSNVYFSRGKRMTQRRFRRVASAASTAALLAAGMSLSALGASPVAASTSCAPAEMVVFRGSAENDANYYDGQGKMLAKFVADARSYPLKDGYSSADVPVYGVPYPAIGMDKWVSYDLFDSIEYGRLLGASYIRTRHSACPDTRFVLLGYSQGVAVAREVAQDINSDVIGGVFGLGDPYQKPNADGVAGAGAAGNGILRLIAGTPEEDAFYDLPTPKFTYCHAEDGICNPSSIESFTFYDHLNYGDDPVELAVLGAEINILLENATKAGPPTGDVGGGSTGGGGTTLAASSTALTSSDNPSVYGEAVTLTANVSGDAGTPSGIVSFYDGPNALGTRLLSGGTAQLSVTLPVGSHHVVDYYSGDAAYTHSSDALDQTVNKAATSTSLASSANPSVYCQQVTLTGSTAVTAPGAGTLTGTTTFFDNGTSLGAAGLDSNGNAQVTAQFFTVGTHPLTASYGGDGNFLASTSARLSQVVDRAPTVTAVTAAPAAANLFGRSSTFTATVTAPPPGCGSPTGTVQFRVDGVQVQTSALNSSSAATLSTSALLPGNHVISVSYAGDTNFLPSSGHMSYAITCSRTITGTVKTSVTASGESTCLVGATVSGSVYVPTGVRLAIVNTTVGGALVANTASGPSMVAVCGSRVGGAADVENGRELVMVGDPAALCASNTVNGSLILRNDAHGLEAIGNTYGGSLLASGDSGPGPFGQATTVSGHRQR